MDLDKSKNKPKRKRKNNKSNNQLIDNLIPQSDPQINDNNMNDDIDDEVILKDKNDILNDELGIDHEHADDNDTSMLGQFDIFSKIFTHNQKFDRSNNVVLPSEDLIELIDENVMYTVNDATIKYEHQFELEQQQIRDEIRQEKLAEVKEELFYVNEFDEMRKENERLNQQLEQEDEYGLGLLNIQKTDHVATTLPSAFKKTDDYVDLSIKRQRKELNVDYANTPVLNPNKENEYAEMTDFFNQMNND